MNHSKGVANGAKGMLKRRLRAFRSLEVIIMIIVLLLITAGFTIYAVNIPASPSFHIYDASFKMDEDSRIIEFHVQADKGTIELHQFFISNEAVHTWNTDKKIIRNGETAKCILEYPWKMGTYYTIKLVTADDQTAEIATKAPEVTASLQLETKNVDITLNSSFLTVNATYQAYSNGTDYLHVIMFTYRSFENKSRPLYMFYDSHYMTEKSLRRADSIIDHFGVYNVTITKLDYGALESISNGKPKCTLILVNPLMDHQGNKIDNAIPAPLVDPDGDRFIRDNSENGKTLLYDWMQDNGLVLVTVGSLQPYKRILYDDGTYVHSSDANETFDAHILLTNASNGESIINGSFVLGDYSPVRISGTMGLSYREASFGFDKDTIQRNGLSYYAYGDYSLPYEQGNLNLTLPAFIQVGEEGGWLAMGDEEFWLKDEQFAHDLFMIHLQAVWDSEWIPHGWYWDSGCTFQESYGTLRVDSFLETLLPSNVVDDKIVVRVIAIAYSSDLDIGIMAEQVVEQEIR
jgi:hypothetical protein